jgi:hypothetical protein
MRWVSLLSLTFSAVTTLGAPGARDSYRLAREIPKAERERIQNAIAATIPVHFADQKCTGVFVGTTGELLTNLHCLEACLDEGGEKVAATENLPDTNFARKRILPGALGTSCPVRFGKKNADGLKLQLVNGHAKLLQVFGPGWTAPREFLTLFALFNPEVVKQLMDEGFEGSGDLVLVQMVEGNRAIESPACATLSELPANQIQDVIGLAYPLVDRKNANPLDPLRAMGATLLWTEGQATRDRYELIRLGKFEESLRAIPYMLARGTFISSIDAERGASGSPVFDRQGSVLGIVRSHWKLPGTNYVPWRTQAVDLDFHRREIMRALGDRACAVKNPTRVR